MIPEHIEGNPTINVIVLFLLVVLILSIGWAVGWHDHIRSIAAKNTWFDECLADLKQYECEHMWRMTHK